MTALPALCPSRPDRPFHGLWSLWDMLELDAGSFYHVTTRLASLRAFLDAKRHESSIGIIESVRASLQSDVADLLDHLDILNARVSRVAANELAQELRFENVTWGEFGEAVRTLDATLNRELSLIPLFVIESEKQK